MILYFQLELSHHKLNYDTYCNNYVAHKYSLVHNVMQLLICFGWLDLKALFMSAEPPSEYECAIVFSKENTQVFVELLF